MKSREQAPPHRLAQLFCVPSPPERREFEERFGVKLLWQGYGMTEIYPHPMRSTIDPGLPYDTIGHAVDVDVDYGAVDDYDRLLAAGEVGELVYRPRSPYAHGQRLLRGARATAETFRNLMFHSGDVGDVDEDGRVHYLRPHAGPHPPPRREHQRRRAGVRRRSATRRSWRPPRLRRPAAIRRARGQARRDPQEPIDLRDYTPGWRRSSRATWSPATSRPATSCPRRPSEKVQKHADRGRRSTARRSYRSTRPPCVRRSTPTSRAVNEDRFDDVAALFAPDATLTAPGVGPLQRPRSRPT